MPLVDAQRRKPTVRTSLSSTPGKVTGPTASRRVVINARVAEREQQPKFTPTQKMVTTPRSFERQSKLGSPNMTVAKTPEARLNRTVKLIQPNHSSGKSVSIDQAREYVGPNRSFRMSPRPGVASDGSAKRIGKTPIVLGDRPQPKLSSATTRPSTESSPTFNLGRRGLAAPADSGIVGLTMSIRSLIKELKKGPANDGLNNVQDRPTKIYRPFPTRR